MRNPLANILSIENEDEEARLMGQLCRPPEAASTLIFVVFE
jgi:hypothetical protein